VKVRGRVWLGLWLLAFLTVSLLVIARQRAALDTAAQLNLLRETRLALEAERAEYERRIREGSSRMVLVRKAERLRLHLPSDSEFVIFPLPAGADSGG
jgi:cell division protein FtsL